MAEDSMKVTVDSMEQGSVTSVDDKVNVLIVEDHPDNLLAKQERHRIAARRLQGLRQELCQNRVRRHYAEASPDTPSASGTTGASDGRRSHRVRFLARVSVPGSPLPHGVSAP